MIHQKLNKNRRGAAVPPSQLHPEGSCPGRVTRGRRRGQRGDLQAGRATLRRRALHRLHQRRRARAAPRQRALLRPPRGPEPGLPSDTLRHHARARPRPRLRPRAAAPAPHAAGGAPSRSPSHGRAARRVPAREQARSMHHLLFLCLREKKTKENSWLTSQSPGRHSKVHEPVEGSLRWSFFTAGYAPLRVTAVYPRPHSRVPVPLAGVGPDGPRGGAVLILRFSAPLDVSARRQPAAWVTVPGHSLRAPSYDAASCALVFEFDHPPPPGATLRPRVDAALVTGERGESLFPPLPPRAPAAGGARRGGGGRAQPARADRIPVALPHDRRPRAALRRGQRRGVRARVAAQPLARREAPRRAAPAAPRCRSAVRAATGAPRGSRRRSTERRLPLGAPAPLDQ